MILFYCQLLIYFTFHINCLNITAYCFLSLQNGLYMTMRSWHVFLPGAFGLYWHYTWKRRNILEFRAIPYSTPWPRWGTSLLTLNMRRFQCAYSPSICNMRLTVCPMSTYTPFFEATASALISSHRPRPYIQRLRQRCKPMATYTVHSPFTVASDRGVR